MLTTVSVPPELLRALLAAARAELPREWIAALGGRVHAGRVRLERFEPLRTVAASAHHFVVDPVAFVQQEHALRRAGSSWLGFVHSHPHGGLAPSLADREASWRDCLQCILSPRGGGALAAFVHRGSAYEPLPVVVAGDNLTAGDAA